MRHTALFRTILDNVPYPRFNVILMKENWERSTKFMIIDKQLAMELLNPVFGNSKLLDLQLLTGGLSNTNYKIRIQRDNDIISTNVLRIYSGLSDFHGSSELCLKEKSILQLVKSKVPVPDCIFSSSEENSMNYAYMVQSWVEGNNLGDFLQSPLSVSQKMRIALLLGEVLANIHSFKFENHGILGSELKVITPFIITPETYIAYMRQFLFEGHARKGLSQVHKEEIWRWVQKSKNLLSDLNPTPCLVHMDFNPLNILISDEENELNISGILDWEFALSGSKLFDFGNLFRYERDLQNPFVKKIVYSYLQNGGDLPETWPTLIRLLDLLSIFSMLNRENCDLKKETDLKSLIKFYLHSKSIGG